MKNAPTDCVWSDRKRTLFGLPWSFTRYYLTKSKLIVITGFLKQSEEEIRLYRVMDVSLSRSLTERMNKVGTIHCCTADKTAPELDIRHVKDARRVKELLSDMVEEQRAERGVSLREDMFHDMRDGDHDGSPD